MMSLGDTRGRLAEFIERGGVYRDIQGSTPLEVLTALVACLPPSPSIRTEKLLEAMLEREALMSTGIGDGIAIPHPRNPIVKADLEQFAVLAFLKNPVDWNSPDGVKVDTLLLIVSSSAKQHLHTLGEIAFFCRQEDFSKLLRERASGEELLRFIREAEVNWK